MKFPTIEERAKNVAEKALDEWEYKGKTLRQWVEIILATDINVATKQGTDCISRQQAIDMCREPRMRNADCSDFEMGIMMLPPIQPDIVRCKDCKYWMPYDWMFSEVWQSKNMADYPEDEMGCNWCDMAMKANDFCSRGEKRGVKT